MTDVRDFLTARRKAELQTIHQFWFPGEAMLTRRNALEERLAQALSGDGNIAEGVARLNRVQQALLRTVLAEPGHEGECRQIHARLENDGTPPFEVENAGRMLQERGFLGRCREPARGERYLIPDELAGQLEEVFELGVQRVEPADQLSQRRLPFEIDFEEGESLASRVERLTDPVLGQLVRIAMENQGLASDDTPGVRELLDETRAFGAGVPAARRNGRGATPARRRPATRAVSGSGLDGERRAEWARQLEEAGVGTIGSVSLGDFGITVHEPALIVFQEWVQRQAREALTRPPRPDTVIEAGIDLAIDLDRMATFLDEGLQLTRGEKLPRRAYEALRKRLHLTRIESYLDGDVVLMLLGHGRRIGIVERYAGRLEVHGERLRVWRKLELVRQVEMLLERFLEERQGMRWSFHQEMLRRILLDSLRKHVKEEWVPLDALVGLVISTYLLELEEREVRETLRLRREEDFARERLQSQFQRLAQDLVYWIVNRLLLLGVCELGYTSGKLVGFRLTALGKEVFGIQRRPRESRMLVNPDLEVMLITEGLRGMHMELGLARFAERVSAEQVRRYRLTRESVREGIRAGLSLADIEEQLRKGSQHPLPETVRVALRDWGKDIDWVDVRPAIVLEGIRRGRARELAERLEELGCRHLVCADDTVLIHPDEVAGDGWQQALEELRDTGWLFREGNGEPEADAETVARTAAARRGAAAGNGQTRSAGAS